MAFLNALLDAEGIDLDSQSSTGNSRGRRNPTFKVSVQSNGNVLLGRSYTRYGRALYRIKLLISNAKTTRSLYRA